MAPPSCGRHPPPALPDELVQEILIRLPPDDPSCLLRASLVCKPWRGLVSHPDFLRRLRALHRTPPVLGFLHNPRHCRIPRFVPTTASAFSLPAPDYRSWQALDCRQGRALFVSNSKDTLDLLVWEPITGNRWHVPPPAAFKSGRFSAAVVCAADECNHHDDGHGGPFRVVFFFGNVLERVTSACVYSSETSAWVTSVFRDSFVWLWMKYRPRLTPSVLVGKSLLCFLCRSGYILQYDLARRSLAMIDPPDAFLNSAGFIILMPGEGGGVGVAGIKQREASESSSLILWSREVSDAGWVQSRAIDLENLLPVAARPITPNVIGFAEESNVIFLNTSDGIFAMELGSERVRKVCESNAIFSLIPFSGFYIPGLASKELQEDDRTDLKQLQEVRCDLNSPPHQAGVLMLTENDGN